MNLVMVKTSRYILVSLSAFLLFINADCKKDPVTPDDVKPGSRNYTWTVDTIYGPFNPFTSITGISPTDLWTANPGDADKIFYHFDGVKWTTDLIPRPFSPFSIYSFNSTNVWSVGLQGEIWHFDGTQWLEILKYSLGNNVEVYLQDVYTLSLNNVYAVGAYTDNQDYWGIILHYNGNSWGRVNIPKFRTLLAKTRISNNGKFYLWGLTNEQFTESTYQLYELEGTTLTQIKSGTQANDQFGSIVELGKRIYFIIGFDLFDYTSDSFTKIARLSDLPEFLNVGFGRSIKDIFLGMRNGIAHYNGTNTEYLIKTEENTFIRHGIVFNKDVFMMGRDSKGNNLIYHGKLNE